MPNVNSEAEHVQHAPRLEPRDAEDREIEHRVVAEQRDVIARARRHEHGREEAADDAEHRQRARVLQHGERAGAAVTTTSSANASAAGNRS